MQHGTQMVTLCNVCTNETFVDRNCRPHMSIRVLPIVSCKFFPQKLKNGGNDHTLICINHIVPLPPSLSPIFSFETHIFTGRL